MEKDRSEVRWREMAESRDFHTRPVSNQSGRWQACDASATEIKLILRVLLLKKLRKNMACYDLLPREYKRVHFRASFFFFFNYYRGLTPHCKDKIPKFRNKYSQKKNIGASVPISTFMLL
jgi:hypothetical protein